MLNASLDRLGDRVVLFRCGRFVFVTFGLFAGLGTGLALLLMGAILMGQGIAPELFFAFSVLGSGAIVVGSWLVAQARDWRLVLASPWTALRRPVFVSWGGLAGLVLVVVGLSAVYAEVSVPLLLDAVARSAPLGHALGRLGCLSYGCCFGRPTRGPVAITYWNPLAKAVRLAGLRGVRLHPAAFYEAVTDIGIFAAVNAAAVLGAPVGVPFSLTLLLYGAGRFAIEFLRNNHGRVVFGGLALNHFICLGLVAFGVLAVPSFGLASTAAPAFSWPAALAVAPRVVPVVLPAALLSFLGFSLHRERVGAW